MAMKQEIEGYAITAFVAVNQSRDANWAVSEARNVAELIKHHVAPHADIESAVDIEPQVRRICDYCGYPWTGSDPTFNGGCCAEDAENDPEPAEAK